MAEDSKTPVTDAMVEAALHTARMVNRAARGHLIRVLEDGIMITPAQMRDAVAAALAAAPVSASMGEEPVAWRVKITDASGMTKFVYTECLPFEPFMDSGVTIRAAPQPLALASSTPRPSSELALREALGPFADVADFMDSETSGFSDSDILHLVVKRESGDGIAAEFFAWPVRLFRNARAALTTEGQAAGLTEWRDDELPEHPKQGLWVDVRQVTTFRYLPYKPGARKQMRRPGRWQRANEYGWENCERPEGEWKPNEPLPALTPEGV